MGQTAARPDSKPPARIKWTSVELRVIDGDLRTGLSFVDIQIKGTLQLEGTQRRYPFEMGVKTGIDGACNFRLRAGSYTAKIIAPQYVPAWGCSNSVAIDVPSDAPETIKIKALFYRPAELSGHVADYDSGQPLRDIHASAIHSDFVRGIQRFSPALPATTDKDGNFAIADLAPGDYFVELIGTGPERVLGKDAPPENGYGTSFWPGTAENPSPFRLQSGARHDVGLVQLHPTELRTLDIGLKSGSCIPGLPYTATLLSTAASTRVKHGEFIFFCEDALRLGGITPGMYDIFLVQRADLPAPDNSDVRLSGSESVDLGRKNQKVEVALAGPVDIIGQVKMEQQNAVSNTDPIPHFTIRLSVVDNSNVLKLPHFDASVNDDGSYVGRVMPFPGNRVRVTTVGLPPELALKEVTYDLIPCASPTFAMNQTNSQQELTLTLSRQVSHVTGKVTGDSDQGLSDFRIVAVPWPSKSENDYPVVVHESTSDNEGKFEFNGLLAGAYKIIAVNPEDRSKLEEPGKLLQVIAGVDSIKVPGGNFNMPPLNVVRF
jgi:hypothetical protein